MVEYNGLTDLEAESITFWAVRFRVALEEFLTVSLIPVLAVAIYRAGIHTLPGEAVPLALRAQATEDAIEDPPQVHPSMPLRLRGIILVQNLVDNGPDVIGYFPDGRRWLLLNPSLPWQNAESARVLGTLRYSAELKKATTTPSRSQVARR